MSKQKTITISPDTLERFDWYRTTFNYTSDELLNYLMDKLSLATAEQVKQFKKNFQNKGVEVGVE